MNRLHTRPQSNKTSDLPPGVSAFVERGRWPNSEPCVTFGVYYHQGNRARIRNFRTPVDANDAQIDHARRTACAFRAAYVAAVESGAEFDPGSFKDWRTQRLYDGQACGSQA